MNWLSPLYRILHGKKLSNEVFNKLRTYFEVGSLFCYYNNERVALVTALENSYEAIYTIYELKPNSLLKINSEQYYIEPQVQTDYIDGGYNISNILLIKEKE